MNLLILCLGAGLVCLGVLVAVGPLLEGEGRGWAMVAFAALGLLVAGVGALMLWGGAILALEDLRGLARWSYGLELTRPEARYSGSGTATFARTRLLHAQGRASMELSLGARQSLRPPTGLSPAQQIFARALALLYQRGQVALWWSRTTSWTIGSPGKVRLLGRHPPISTETATTMKLQLVVRRMPGPPDDESRALLAALAPLHDGPTPVIALWRSCHDLGLDALPSPSVAASPDGCLGKQAVAAEISDEHLN